MAEHIEREALLKRLDMAIDCKNCPRCVDMKTYYDRCAYTDIQDVCGVISDMPAADVQPVKRGHWYDVGAEYIKEIGQFKIHAFCSKCHRLNYHLSDYSQNMEAEFCQHCGADMQEADATKG